MAYKKPISEPSAFAGAQRPQLAESVDRTYRHLDSFEVQQDWQARIDASLIEVVR